jgi:hypothetical protein
MLRSFCNIKILLVNYLGCEASLEMDISCIKGKNSHIYSVGYTKKSYFRRKNSRIIYNSNVETLWGRVDYINSGFQNCTMLRSL